MYMCRPISVCHTGCKDVQWLSTPQQPPIYSALQFICPSCMGPYYSWLARHPPQRLKHNVIDVSYHTFTTNGLGSYNCTVMTANRMMIYIGLYHLSKHRRYVHVLFIFDIYVCALQIYIVRQGCTICWWTLVSEVTETIFFTCMRSI
jgi:hypothetical protein